MFLPTEYTLSYFPPTAQEDFGILVLEYFRPAYFEPDPKPDSNIFFNNFDYITGTERSFKMIPQIRGHAVAKIPIESGAYELKGAMNQLLTKIGEQLGVSLKGGFLGDTVGEELHPGDIAIPKNGILYNADGLFHHVPKHLESKVEEIRGWEEELVKDRKGTEDVYCDWLEANDWGARANSIRKDKGHYGLHKP